MMRRNMTQSLRPSWSFYRTKHQQEFARFLQARGVDKSRHIMSLTTIRAQALNLTMRKKSRIIVGSLVERCPSG